MGNDAGHIRSHCSPPLGGCVGSLHQARSSALHGLRLPPFSKRTSCLPGMEQVVLHLHKWNSTPLLSSPFPSSPFHFQPPSSRSFLGSFVPSCSQSRIVHVKLGRGIARALEDRKSSLEKKSDLPVYRLDPPSGTFIGQSLALPSDCVLCLKVC